MAISPQKVVRGTPVVFEQLFVEDDAVTPIVPMDPVAYPSISIVSPSEEVIQSGVAISAGSGRWRFTWYVPADIEVQGPDNPWRIDWVIVTNGGRQIERQANFVVIDNIEASPDERAYTNLTYIGNSERAVIKFKNAQDTISVALVRGNEQLNLSPTIQMIQSDGFYTYYVDTPPLTATGAYLMVWTSRQTPISQTTTMIQQLRVPEMMFWWAQPSLRMLMDKVQKKSGHVQSYSDSDLYEYLLRGADYVNAVNPITGWVVNNWPTTYGMSNFLLMAAAWWGLNAQYLSETELNFSYNGQTVTLTADRAASYVDAMGRFHDYLDKQLQQTKRNMLRRQSVGAIATRPYDFGLQSLVTRVQSSSGQNQILPMFSRMGLL